MNRKQIRKAIALHPEYSWAVRDTFISDSVENLDKFKLAKLAEQVEKLADSIKKESQEKSNAYAVAGSFYFFANQTDEALDVLKKSLLMEESSRLAELLFQAIESLPLQGVWRQAFTNIEKVYA